jgi:hypothetical protein
MRFLIAHTETITTTIQTLFFFFLDGYRMWMKESMNDENIPMIIFLLIFFFSINLTNGIVENSTNNSLSIEELLHQQYANRQITYTNRTSSIRPWKKSNSIESLKKMIASRQRLAINNRTSPLTSVTSM